MEIVKSILTLGINQFISLENQQLSEILEKASPVSETDTIISGKIRVLMLGDKFFLQETTNKDEIIIRRVKDESAANQLLSSRMEIYEKMWDGCGCKIDYYG